MLQQLNDTTLPLSACCEIFFLFIREAIYITMLVRWLLDKRIKELKAGSLQHCSLQQRPPIITAAAVWDYECTSAAPLVSLSRCVYVGPVTQCVDLCVAPAPTCQALGYTCSHTHGYTRSHTGCIQMHTQSKYSLRQAELLILLLFPLQHFHSPQLPLFSLSLPVSLACSHPSSSSRKEQLRLWLPSLQLPLLCSSSPFLPRSLSQSIYRQARSVGGYVYVALTSLTFSPAFLQSLTPFSLTHSHNCSHAQTHIFTHRLWSLACPVLLTSTAW